MTIRLKCIRLFLVILLSLAMAACKTGEGNWIERTEWNAIGIVVNLLIALVGGAIGCFIKQNAAQQKKLEEARVRREEELEEARVERERRVQEARARLAAFDGYRRELARFADTAIDTMGDIQTLIAFDPDRAHIPAQARQQFVEQRSKLIGQISSLIDRGRFFFPNRAVADVGAHNGPAQQGLRDPVLNRIMAASHFLKAIDYQDFARNRDSRIRWDTLTTVTQGSAGHVCSGFRHLSQAEQSRLVEKLTTTGSLRLMDLIVSAKRAFVSEVFSILQPANWLKQVEDAYAIKLLSRELEEPDVHIPAAQ